MGSRRLSNVQSWSAGPPTLTVKADALPLQLGANKRSSALKYDVNGLRESKGRSRPARGRRRQRPFAGNVALVKSNSSAFSSFTLPTVRLTSILRRGA